MGRLLKFEYRRLFKSVSFYVFFAIIAGVSFIRISSASDDYYGYARNYVSDYILSAYSNTNMILLLAVFIPLYICKNFSHGTVKTVCSKGYGFEKLAFAQLIVVLSVTVAYCICCLLCETIFSALFFKHSGSFDGVIRSLVLQTLCILSFACVFFGLTESVAKNGGAIALNLVFFAMGSLAFSLIETILYKLGVDTNITDFWLSIVYYSSVSRTFEVFDIIKITLTSVAFAAFFIGAGWLASKKREL